MNLYTYPSGSIYLTEDYKAWNPAYTTQTKGGAAKWYSDLRKKYANYQLSNRTVAWNFLSRVLAEVETDMELTDSIVQQTTAQSPWRPDPQLELFGYIQLQ